MKQYLDISPEVAEAITTGKAVVALESTIISHGMPYPKNVETALRVEKTIRDPEKRRQISLPSLYLLMFRSGQLSRWLSPLP